MFYLSDPCTTNLQLYLLIQKHLYICSELLIKNIMEFYFDASVRLTLEHKQGSTTSQHVATDFFIEVSPNLKVDTYMNENYILTKEGASITTQCLIQGLVGNIHFSHAQGYRNDAEHLRYIISELERGFVQLTEIQKGTF